MFFVPTGTDNAIDTCDIVLAVSAGGGCACTLLDGSVLRIAATVDDFAAEVNALYPQSEPFMLGPLPLSSGQVAWLAAAKVQRIQPDRDPLQSRVSMLSLRSLLLIPVTVADAVLFLNTTSGGCGGGGSGPPAGGAYVTSAIWTPTINPLSGNTVTANLNGDALFTRIGTWQVPAPQAPQAYDMMQLQCEFFCIIPAGQPLSFEVTNLPDIIRNGYFTATWNATRISGDPFEAEEIRFNRQTDTIFNCATNNWNAVAETTIRLDAVVTYQVDGV